MTTRERKLWKTGDGEPELVTVIGPSQEERGKVEIRTTFGFTHHVAKRSLKALPEGDERASFSYGDDAA